MWVMKALLWLGKLGRTAPFLFFCSFLDITCRQRARQSWASMERGTSILITVIHLVFAGLSRAEAENGTHGADVYVVMLKDVLPWFCASAVQL